MSIGPFSKRRSEPHKDTRRVVEAVLRSDHERLLWRGRWRDGAGADRPEIGHDAQNAFRLRRWSTLCGRLRALRLLPRRLRATRLRSLAFRARRALLIERNKPKELGEWRARRTTAFLGGARGGKEDASQQQVDNPLTAPRADLMNRNSHSLHSATPGYLALSQFGPHVQQVHKNMMQIHLSWESK